MKKIITFLFIIALFFITTNSGSAQLIGGEALEQLQNNAQIVKTSSGFTDNASIETIIATIVQTILGLLAVIFLVLMVFAGFQWMTASGNEAQVKKSLETLKGALIGLIIVLAAYAITYFIFTQLPFSSGMKIGSSKTGGAIVSGGE